MSIAILAFGSLIDDPGTEIAPVIVSRRNVTTPFKVEFGRLSKGRSGAPTLVPVEQGGAAVPAKLLVLQSSVTADEAKSLLWRRETRREHSGEIYREVIKPGANRVLIKTIVNAFDGMDAVLYVDFPEEGKLQTPSPKLLARNAIASAAARIDGLDGISYLISAKTNGIRTPLMGAYEATVLELVGAVDLEDARRRARLANSQNNQRQQGSSVNHDPTA